MKEQPESRDFILYRKYYNEFIDHAAHDLDAPLRKLTILVEKMMEKVRSGQQVDEQATRIQSCLADMRGMIDGLTRLAGHATPESDTATVDLHEIVQTTISEWQEKNSDRAFEVELAALPMIEGHAESLKIVVYELLENAIRFGSGERPLRVIITSALATTEEKSKHQLTKDRPHYKINFADNGTGFADADAQRIFEPFVRLHGKSEYPGYGLGLSVCRRIVENHAGVIYAESQNEGAQFVLLLPQSLD